ncbi:MAG: four helix bundle protein [Chloroflexi bacterium]|nr:four helix bundle protein [Chloroflexota bacterium]MBU1662820.1 four helix bundle protein [Chloroflexota bacterium]
MEEERDFESLASYQHALKLLQAAYRLANELPAFERYNLADQLRRSALSVLLNIAEGYGRYHYLDRLRFFYIARGSLTETLSAFISAHALEYIDDEQLTWVRKTETEAEKSLNGYIAFIRKQERGSKEYGNKYMREEQAEYHITLQIPDSLVPIP